MSNSYTKYGGKGSLAEFSQNMSEIRVVFTFTNSFRILHTSLDYHFLLPWVVCQIRLAKVPCFLVEHPWLLMAGFEYCLVIFLLLLLLDSFIFAAKSDPVSVSDGGVSEMLRPIYTQVYYILIS